MSSQRNQNIVRSTKIDAEEVRQNRRLSKQVRSLQGLLAEMRKSPRSRADARTELAIIRELENVIELGDSLAWSAAPCPVERARYEFRYEAVIRGFFGHLDDTDGEI
jgi:hypothetical protein